jgi:hypothetical protein
MRADPSDYAAVALRAHALLADVPLHDVWTVRLEGGGPGRTIDDLRALLTVERLSRVSPAVRFLFGLRALLGRLLGAERARPDEHDRAPSPASYLHRLSDADRAASRIAPGTREGPFDTLLVTEREAILEAINRTVHAFMVSALVPEGTGYRFYWGIYVAPVGSITRWYMALIDPFRHWIVYPATLRFLERSWREQVAPKPAALPRPGPPSTT